MREMNSLTLNGKKYDTFVDDKAREMIGRRSNLTSVSEIVGVARSYHKARYQADGVTPTFLYDTANTPLTGKYDPGSEEFAGAIDCSTYVGLILRGIPFEKSPYAHLLPGAQAGDDDAADADTGADNNDGDDNATDTDGSGSGAKFDPASLVANVTDFGWAINPFEWKLPLVPGGEPKPIRTASQLAQWMYERGMSVPLDETFSNLMPGDIIYWAKKKSNGDWVQPNRYKHISHVAICCGRYDAPKDDPDWEDWPAKYPYRHTTLEVTTISPYVLNRTLEVRSPDSVAMICRPDLGSLSSGDFKGNLSTNFGVTDISTWYRPGLYYLTSDVVGGLPDGVESGKYCTLRVEVSRSRQGSVRTITHTLINAKTNEVTHVNTQYCYNRLPGKDNWAGWRSEGTGSADYVLTESDKAEMVEDVLDAMDGIPSYWQTALDNGMKAINTALCNAGRNKSAFLFYSDAHWNYGSRISPTLLKYLHKHTGMAKTFFGGDIVNDEATDYDTMEYLWDWRRQLKDLPNHHSVPGNHDDGNATNNLFSEQYVYGYLLAAEETPDVVRGDGGLYYYIDNPAEQTRYLCLDTGFKDLNSLSDAQATFIEETLKTTLDGWHIVTVAHIWFAPDYTQSSVRPIPIVGLSTTAASVATILDNYNARNGEFANCGAKVEFCIGGHVHRDYVGTTDGGIPIIVVETDSKHIRSELSYNSGTTDEASVNGIIADYNTGILNVVRVGRGNSFTVDLASGESTENPDDGGNSGEPTYTNVLAAVGYEVGRINSSGQFKTDRTDRKATGFINAKTGDTVYFKNISMLGSDYGRAIAFYGSGQTFISGKAFVIPDGASYAAFEADGTMKSCYINIDNVEWVRFTFVDITADSIITINEPID